MTPWRHGFPLVAAAAALALLFTPLLRRDASESRRAARLPAPHALPEPGTRRPPPVAVRVVPTRVAFPVARYLSTPAVDALARRLVVTEKPRLHQERETAGAAVEPPAESALPSSPTAAADSTFGRTFDSLGESQNSFVTPPDPHGAVGPDRVMDVMNISVAWHLKDGTLEHSAKLRDFFVDSLDSSIIADPRVVYDDFEDRFVVSTLELTTSPWSSRVLLAVSATGDPNGSWTQTSINTFLPIGGHTFGDYPTLALDHRALYLTTNQYTLSGLLVDARVFVVAKGAGQGGLYDGGSAAVSVLDPPGAEFNFSLSPARVYGFPANPAVGTYLTSYNGLSDPENGDAFLQVFTLTNPLTAPTFQQEFVNLGPVDSFSNIPPAPQWSGAKGIDTGGRLLQTNTVWRNDYLYVSTELTPTTGPDAGSGTTHWVQMNAASPSPTTVFDQGDAGAEDIAPGTRTFWPSVAVNANGALGISFAMSGPKIHPGAGFAFRRPTDPPGTTRATETLRSGQAYYVYLDGTRNRWGDYTGVDADPVTGCFWSFNEYAIGPNLWGTAWGEKCPDQVCGDGQVDPGESCDPPGALCRADCTSCGDGKLDAKDGELCDDGNPFAGDGCAADCTPEYCGDGSVLASETCDPPAPASNEPFACRANCTSCGDGTQDGSLDLIANGDFESADLLGWTQAGAGNGTFSIRAPGDMVPLSGWPTKPNPDGGRFYTVSDQSGPGAQALFQVFTLPANATTATLQFQMFVNNWNSSKNPVLPALPHPGTFINLAGLDYQTASPNQHARVDILRPGFDPFSTAPAAVVSNLYLGADPLSPPANAYKPYTFDLLAKGLVPGQTYLLRFAATENQAAIDLGVDNVHLVVTPGEPCDDGNNAPNDTCQSFCAPCTTAIFPTVKAASKETFAWNVKADVTYVVGDLADVASLTSTQYFAVFASAVDLPAVPPPGAGRFYLFRYHCPGATWISGGASEVGDRDSVLP